MHPKCITKKLKATPNTFEANQTNCLLVFPYSLQLKNRLNAEKSRVG